MENTMTKSEWECVIPHMEDYQRPASVIQAIQMDKPFNVPDDTPNGMHGNAGDWLICGVNGQYYPCAPDVFEATYSAVDTALKGARMTKDGDIALNFTKTLGEKRMRTPLNVVDNEFFGASIDGQKRMTARQINYLDAKIMQNENADGETKRLAATAMTALEKASFLVTKALTSGCLKEESN